MEEKVLEETYKVKIRIDSERQPTAYNNVFVVLLIR
jgi:hypothetical protein